MLSLGGLFNSVSPFSVLRTVYGLGLRYACIYGVYWKLYIHVSILGTLLCLYSRGHKKKDINHES